MTLNTARLEFDLLLFHKEIRLSCTYLKAGASGVIVDLEHQGKHRRQAGFDTEINTHCIDDVRLLRSETDGPVICRLSGPNASEKELAALVRNGADELIIPMVRTPTEVERIIHLVGTSCRVMVMIETLEATKHVQALCALPIDRIYVGLNDLHISRRSPNIFTPLADGLLADVRRQCGGIPFGFGGLTLPERGAPLPAKYLFAEMARLDCRFSFLRRSFYKDVAGLDPTDVIHNMRQTMTQMRGRTERAVQAQRHDMIAAIGTLSEANEKV